MSCTSCDFVHVITCTKLSRTCYSMYKYCIKMALTCTKYCLRMALTCTIYENNLNLKIKNNFKSEVMKSNNQKQKKHNIQHA